MEFNTPVMSHIIILICIEGMVFTCTQRNLDIQIPPYMTVFLRVPVIFIVYKTNCGH